MAFIATCIAPVNIAVIKYWGKRDENLILPLNDSISVTLDTDQMHAKTTVMASADFKQDQIWLNGKKESVNENPRLVTCLQEIRKRVKKQSIGTEGECRADWKIHICSENNFPTAAGLASSAAGYACLVYSLAKLFNLEGDISGVARLGSGSACRSLDSGFVRWRAGCSDDGSDSIAEQIVSDQHWPGIRVLILVVNDSKKKTSSTDGMQRSVLTSELLKYRVEHCVPQRVTDIIDAINDRDFSRLADITMKDSNQFHSVCLDTFPPAVYMNDVSHAIVEFVHAYNRAKCSTKLCYTFDAGPNACLLMLEDDVDEIISLICEVFPSLDSTVLNGNDNGSHDNVYVRGLPYNHINYNQGFNLKFGPLEGGLLKYMIHTRVGSGPKLLSSTLDDSVHLIHTDATKLTTYGLPKTASSTK